MPVIALGPIAFAIRRDFDLSVAQIGFAYTAYFLASTLLTGVGGWLISKFSTLSVMRAGLAGAAALSAAMAFATSSFYVLVLSTVAGAVNGLITPSINVLITQLVPVRLRGLAFGIKVGAAPGAASMAALGGWTAANLHAPWQVLYGVCAGIGCAVMGATLLLGRGDRGEVIVDAGQRTESGLNSRRSLILLAIGGLLGTSGTAVLAPFLVDGLIDHGLAPGTATSVLALSSCLGLVSRVAVGGLSDRWPDPLSHLWAVAGMLMVAAVSLVFLAFGGGEFMLVAAAIAAFVIGWAWPGLIHYAVIATHTGAPAIATSYMQSGTFLGAVLGPLGFGLLADYASFAAAWSVAGLSAVAAAVFLAAGARSLGHSRQQAAGLDPMKI
jgi:MFS family permease